MKTAIFISFTLLSAFSYMAFDYINCNDTSCTPMPLNREQLVANNFDPLNPFTLKLNSKLHYQVGSRFINTVKGEDLYTANTIIEILPEKATTHMKEYGSVEVSLIDNEASLGASESGEDQNLNIAQKKFIQTFDYSTDFHIRAIGKRRIPNTEELRDLELTYFMTIIPEKEAKYSEGHDNLIKYLRDNSKKETADINRSNLKPGKVNFIVTKNGSIDKIELISTCGYPDLDETLVEMIHNLPGTWEPAMNAKGEKVDQKLVFSFGIEGC